MKTKNLYYYIGLLFIPVILSMSGCGKGNPDSSGPYYVKFKANGTQITYNIQSSLYASNSISGAQYYTQILGFTATSNFSCGVYASSAVVIDSSYTGYTFSNASLVGVQLIYQDDSKTSYTESDNTGQDVVSFSNITSTTMQGNFSGVVKSAGKADITITDGQFFVKRAS